MSTSAYECLLCYLQHPWWIARAYLCSSRHYTVAQWWRTELSCRTRFAATADVPVWDALPRKKNNLPDLFFYISDLQAEDSFYKQSIRKSANHQIMIACVHLNARRFSRTNSKKKRLVQNFILQNCIIGTEYCWIARDNSIRQILSQSMQWTVNYTQISGS